MTLLPGHGAALLPGHQLTLLHRLGLAPLAADRLALLTRHLVALLPVHQLALALLNLLTFLLGNIATLLGEDVMASLVITNRLAHWLGNAATFILVHCRTFLAGNVLINKIQDYFFIWLDLLEIQHLALLLLHRGTDLVQHLSALLRGGGLALLLELSVALLILDRGALDLLHISADLFSAGGALLLVHSGALLILLSPALLLLDSLLRSDKLNFSSNCQQLSWIHLDRLLDILTLCLGNVTADLLILGAALLPGVVHGVAALGELRPALLLILCLLQHLKI